jgi:hypothetical protein
MIMNQEAMDEWETDPYHNKKYWCIIENFVHICGWMVSFQGVVSKFDFYIA